MKHLIGIDSIQHLDCQNNIKWEAKNLLNTLHYSGEEFVLRSVFIGGKADNAYIPNFYYFGLDNRPSLSASDVMSSLISEPTLNGYLRIPISSSDEFSLGTSGSNKKINSPIVTFQATGGSWGPVRNLFLTDKPDGSGYLISSVYLGSSITVLAGESINLRLGIVLKDCA